MLGFVAGVALTAWLLASYDVGRILDLVGHAGLLGIGAVVLAHLTQVLSSGSAWHAITPVPRLGLRGFVVLRWIREGVNNLLPVAQVGGQVVTAWLMQRRGVPLAASIAGIIGDLTVEMATQIAFVLLGLGLLLLLVGDQGLSGTVMATLAVAIAAVGGFLAAQWLGGARLAEVGLMRLGRVVGKGWFSRIEGLHEAVTGLYRSKHQVLACAAFHSASWLLGGFEVWVTLHVLGHGLGLGAAVVVECLGQAVKAAGFAVPGALGVQEGGYVVICGLFGLLPDCCDSLIADPAAAGRGARCASPRGLAAA